MMVLVRPRYVAVKILSEEWSACRKVRVCIDEILTLILITEKHLNYEAFHSDFFLDG